MNEYTKEITGDRLNKFLSIYKNENRYLTEDELCQKYSLDRVQLYNFFGRLKRLEKDGSHMGKNFIPKPNTKMEFGPLVKLNNSICYLNTYWATCFADPVNRAALQDCQKNSVLVSPKTDNSKPSRRSRAVVKDEHLYSYISSIALFKDGKLYEIDPKTSEIKRHIDNTSGKTTIDHKGYTMLNLIRALVKKEDYRSRYPNDDEGFTIPTTPETPANLDTMFKTLINESKTDTKSAEYTDDSVTLIKLKVFELAIKAHATDSSRTVDQHYAWISSELSK